MNVPSDLLAVMSASNPKEKNKEGNYHFEMKQPIPCYLIALAVGDLVYGDLGNQTGVYCEPELLDASMYEFEDLPNMMKAAEKLYGAYTYNTRTLLPIDATHSRGIHSTCFPCCNFLLSSYYR